MSKISELEHILISMDDVKLDGRRDLQKKENNEGEHRWWICGDVSDA